MELSPFSGPGLFVLGSIALLGLHAGLCWRLVGGWGEIDSGYPILTDDHPIFYYSAVVTREFLRQSGTTAGYDPNFMAGYAKSVVWPSSSTLIEVLTFSLGGSSPQRLYNLYVVGAPALAPLGFWVAAIIWRLRPPACLLALGLYLVYYWTDWGVNFTIFGMVAFLLSGPLTLLAMGLLARCLEALSRPAAIGLPAGERRWAPGWWIGTALMTAAACLVHPVSAMVVVPGFLAGCILRSKRLGWARLAAMTLAAGIVLALNSFWLVPLLALRQTLGETAVFFVNPNVLERLLEIPTTAPRVEPVVLMLGAAGLWIGGGPDRTARWILGTGLAWVFFLAYPAGSWRSLDFIEPGRNTMYLYCWGALAAGMGAEAIMQRWADCFRRFRRPALVLFVGAAITAIGAALAEPVRLTLAAGQPILPTRMPHHLDHLLHRLRNRTKPGQRILFEECNRGVFSNGRRLPDPFGRFRISPLIPLETGLEVVGGPYLYAHQRTNFTQFGDGRFLGQPEIDPARFARYCQWYDLSWIVCWSPAAQQFCLDRSELVEIIERVPHPHGEFYVGSIRREPNPAIVGQAEILALPGRIEVRNARPANGILVLRYHWSPCLESDPPTTISPFPIGDDPVGLIQITDPPPNFTLRLDPWHLPAGLK